MRWVHKAWRDCPTGPGTVPGSCVALRRASCLHAGRDPKPFPPPMKLAKEMVDAMGGQDSEHYRQFKVGTWGEVGMWGVGAGRVNSGQ